jgi:hypothetical protein
MKYNVLSFFSYASYMPANSGYYLVTDFKEKKFWWAFYHNGLEKWSSAHVNLKDLIHQVQTTPSAIVCSLPGKAFVGNTMYWWGQPPPGAYEDYKDSLEVINWSDVKVVKKDHHNYWNWDQKILGGGAPTLSSLSYCANVLCPVLDEKQPLEETEETWKDVWQVKGWNNLYTILCGHDGYFPQAIKLVGDQAVNPWATVKYGSLYVKPSFAWTMKDGKITKHEKPKEEEKKVEEKVFDLSLDKLEAVLGDWMLDDAKHQEIMMKAELAKKDLELKLAAAQAIKKVAPKKKPSNKIPTTWVASYVPGTTTDWTDS